MTGTGEAWAMITALGHPILRGVHSGQNELARGGKAF
jgi:hypothetical protein